MHEGSTVCAERRELERRVEEILRKLAALAAEEADLVTAGDQPKIDIVDEDIEATLGEKERAIGALKQHRSHHGC
jgi:hypothetical protein